jgi:hypothetical protein
VTVHREQSVNREKTNKVQQSVVYYQLLSQHVSGIIMPLFGRTRCNNQIFIINFSLKMFRASLCPSSGEQDTTIRCLLSTSVSTCFGHHYAYLQENKDRVTACVVLLWFCWMRLVAVVGRCVVRCEQCSTCFGHDYAHLQENKGPVTAFGVLFWFCWMRLVAVVGRCVVGCEQVRRSCPISVRD